MRGGNSAVVQCGAEASSALRSRRHSSASGCGGENIYSIEVESALYDHPAVMDAAVVGIPHKVLGEEVGAVVQLKPGMSVTEDELRAHVANQLAAFKVPVEIHFMDEPLPRNANGKILKKELREQFTPRG